MISIKDFNLWYDDFHALKDVSLDIPKNQVTAFIGPSGCGKSTLLRAMNRMCDCVPSVRVEGAIELDGVNVFESDSNELRVHVGMVFQHPNPFPMSIRDNILYGPRRMRRLSKAEGDEIVERSLRDAGLFDEVKDKLDQSGLGISGGQQQRLCIARALAVEARGAFDGRAHQCARPHLHPSSRIHAAAELKKSYTVVVVTHNMQQATRVADKTAFFYLGELIEEGPRSRFSRCPGNRSTKEYLTGRFG